jgi:hypothetical protein
MHPMIDLVIKIYRGPIIQLNMANNSVTKQHESCQA